MHPNQFVSILLVLAAASCGRSGKIERNQQQYDAVQEGQAQGVTSTISGPGETPPPLTTSTVTGTNVDTTTAFTALPGTTATTSTQQPGTIASTLPDSTTGFPSGYTPPRPRPRPRTPPATTTAPTTTDTVAPTTTDQKPTPPTGTTGTQG